MSDFNSMKYGPRELEGYGEKPPNPMWPENAKIAVQIVINYEEGSESTPVNGDNLTETLASELGPGITPIEGGVRDVNMESLYEYGSRCGIWRILRLLDEFEVKATAFAVGQALLLNPLVGEALEERGHEVGSHGWRWIDRSSWTVNEEKENIRKCIDAIKKTTPSGTPPRGWYYGMIHSKASERSRSLLAQTFEEEGIPLLWYSDSYSDDLPYWIPYPGGNKDKGLLIIPYTMDTNDYKNAGYQAYITPDQFANYLIASFDELYKEGQNGFPKMMSVGLHSRIVGHPGRIAGLRKFLSYVKSKEKVWFATREEIALHWMKTFPYRTSDNKTQ